MFTRDLLKSIPYNNLIKRIALIIIILYLATPAYAGTPVVDAQIEFSSSMYPGESATLGVLVSEISGSDWVKDVTVSVQVSPGSGVVIGSSTQSVSRIEKKSSKKFYFPIELTDTAISGTRTIYVTVKYYEMDLLNINTLGPYYIQDEQYFTIKNPYGKVAVSTAPSGVEIYLDGKYVGTSPMTISNVMQGKHTLLLKKEGYNEISSSVDVAADSEIYVSKTLSQKTGSVSISTTPGSAKVSIDGRYAGVSPLNADGLLPGSHDISISMEGHRDVHDSFYISAGSATIFSRNLVKQSGSISIDSTPSGASVYLGSSYKGVTPLNIEGLSPGTYTLRLSKDGYKDLQSTTIVKDASISPFSASMKRLSFTENVVSAVSRTSADTSTPSPSAHSSNNGQLLGNTVVVLAILMIIGFVSRLIKKGPKETAHVENQTVIHNIHYGDKIETHIKDSVVQSSNFGSSSFPCPYCGNAIAAGGHYCVECRNMMK